jgi:cholesterol oxidase
MSRISRRTFMKTGAASVAVLGTSRNVWAKKKKFTEALVIGSGFGGAVAALRLAEAGIDTIVLERGRRWDIVNPATNSTFSTFVNPDGRSSWFSETANGIIPWPITKYAGVLEMIHPFSNGPLTNNLRAQGIQVRNGAGVGGGSLVYNAVMLQPRQELFESVFPSDIQYAEMAAEYYPRVRQALGQSKIPADILASPYYASTRANLQNAQNAGMYLGMDVEFNINWDVVREEMAGIRVPSAIDGESWFGLNSGAKNSVDKNYLKKAQDLGVVVEPLHVVTDISETRRDAEYTVVANRIDVDGNVLETVEFTTHHVFMAAGATGTPALLTKAREKGTLPRLNQSVGREWGGNGDFFVVRGGVGNYFAAQGGPCGHFLFEDLNNSHSPTDLVELVVPKDVQQFAFQNAPGFSLYVGLGLAPAVGYFTYDASTDTVTLNWPNTDSRLDAFSAGVNEMLNKLNAANPGSFTAFNSEDPDYKAAGNPAATAHPIGGAVIGKATDMSGRVHGHQGLYVVDGALIPGGSVGGVNPSFTIAALAERTIDRILKGL